MRRMGPRKRDSTPSGGRSTVLTVDGDLISRCELFDEADLDAALARFDELSRPAPRLENAASRVDESIPGVLRGPRLGRLAEMLADDICTDDRRRVVNAGIRRGRDAEIADMRATADVGIHECDDRPPLRPVGSASPSSHDRFSGREPAVRARSTSSARVIEIDADDRIVATQSRSTSTTSTLPSRSSTLVTSPAKRPRTRTRGRSIADAYAAVNRHEMPRRRRTG